MAMGFQTGQFGQVRFSMAFQPVVDVRREQIYAYEALARGPQGQPAGSVFAQIQANDLYAFDHECRSHAINLACRLEMPERGVKLATNFMPGAIYSNGSSVEDTLAVAEDFEFPRHLLIFEINEREEVSDPMHLQRIADRYRRHGFEFAIDDFGAGFANLSLLADLAASTLKIDTSLVRGIHHRPRARKIVSAIVDLCSSLNVRVIAEGVETVEEFQTLQECNIHLMQGFLLARPGFQTLPDFELPTLASRIAVPQLPAETFLPIRSRHLENSIAAA